MDPNAKFRFRVYFAAEVKTPPRDVTAHDDEGARRTALYAERVTMNPRRLRRSHITHVQRLWPVGYRAAEAPAPQPESLFDAQERTDAAAELLR